MHEVNIKELPIGTVVLLKDAKKMLMITGFCCKNDKNPTMVYDYSGCLYPEGILRSDQIASFNHDQIEKVVHCGYISEEEIKFQEKLKKMMEKYNS